MTLTKALSLALASALGLSSFAPAADPAPVLPLAADIDPAAPVVEPAQAQLPAIPATPAVAATAPPAIIPDAPAGASGFDFKAVPPVRGATRPGPFPMPPTGPGYYSVLDLIRQDPQKAPPKYGYPRFALMPQSTFEADFRYLDAVPDADREFYDRLKRMKFGDDWMLSLGGESRQRLMSEYNSRLGIRDNTYVLGRDRAYADLWYKDVARLYVEGISSFSYFQTLPKLPIDETRIDFLNLFVDVKVGEAVGAPVYVRAGRQELNLGSGRLVSTLDWANTRRTFQGVSVLRTGEKWDSTAFWVQPVIPSEGRLDWADTNQHLAGAWLTYRPKPGTAVDLYNLTLVNNNTVVQRGITRAGTAINTTGARFVGDQNNVLWDFEGAIQLGRVGTSDVVAGMGTAGLGYNFKTLPWNPTVWVYYDYASGGRTGGTSNTFNQLFPFGHYYLGWADLVGRQNIHDVSAHLYLYPAKWLTFWTQYHHFNLASSRDALYNAAGNVSRYNPTGAAGTNVGQELDFTANFHLSKRSDVLVGYNYFFAGDFIRKTAAPGQTGGFDSSTFFLQYNFRW